MPLIEFTERGLYCPAGRFYIDPWQAVDQAVITHGHSDHARWGSKNYLCHEDTLPILQLRLGNNAYQALPWKETLTINGVRLTLFPAGHIIGSSQVHVEYQGEVWVVTGDYKLENDGISGAFEPLRCHTLVTESTFGLPIYDWCPQEKIFEDIRRWLLNNQREGKTSVLIAYALGKAQRVLRAVQSMDIRVYAHGAVFNVHDTLLRAGLLPHDLPRLERITAETPREAYAGQLIIAPPAAEGSPWIKRFTPYSIGICSGWMQVRGNQRRKNADAGFVLSDHCDWKGLLSATSASGAEKVFVTHGFQSVFSRYLNEAGIAAAEVKTEFGTEEETEETGEV